MAQEPELVVLVDEHGTPTGVAEKATVHTENTPLHLAFSCYLRNAQGEILLTRRALGKLTWPGVWTNSACGHLAPEETAYQALRRRVPHELGLAVEALTDVREILPHFSYRAVDSKGIVEWELCPVFVAQLSGQEISPRADEVEEHAWVGPSQLLAAIDAAPFAFSPWMVEQLSHPELREVLLEHKSSSI
ncbi:isopentenyl-diphosphate Delta-isomerase [Corynebacterium kozikiae]|uniref:isopentenyl-diphosphate Delta-isomerase n=1 Tax=Corynebacterium kozikiae TaxID=2968469 RepID=UPI00211D050D|nr:isopentenyl-diphosphate Delta-isomerase [Corynebacterium sp. 76QC2CO]MCQ9342163.1 isopentenyl-diphosphate Delta-isomerase [Corynebacterium sp. 76QC2CO]